MAFLLFRWTIFHDFVGEQSKMVFPLGIGVGDFVIVLGLITKVVKAVKKSGGAASDYQDVTLELETLGRILDHVGSRDYTSSIAETLEAVKHLAKKHSMNLPVLSGGHTCFDV